MMEATRRAQDTCQGGLSRVNDSRNSATAAVASPVSVKRATGWVVAVAISRLTVIVMIILAGSTSTRRMHTATRDRRLGTSSSLRGGPSLARCLTPPLAARLLYVRALRSPG